MIQPLNTMSILELAKELNHYIEDRDVLMVNAVANEIRARMARAESEHEELERLRERVRQLEAVNRRLDKDRTDAPEGFYRCPTCRQIFPEGEGHYCTGNPDYNGKAGPYTWERKKKYG